MFATRAIAEKESADRKSKAAQKSVGQAPVSVLPFPVLQRKANCACGGGCPSCQQDIHPETIQTKLQVSTPGDQYEQEADRVADYVMRMPDPSLQRHYQRSSDASGLSSNDADQPLIKLQANGEAGKGEVASDFTSRLGTGVALDAASRSYFEPRFGHDFAHVRLHTDARASASARAVQARAYTIGQDVVFGDGEYAPEKPEGRKLLAHELTHVVQQQTGKGGVVQRHICTLPASTGRLPGTRLSPTEVAHRRSEVARAITASAPTYPLAAANLQHWLNNTGATRVIALREYNFANADTGIPAHLLNEHRQRISGGVRARMNPAHSQSLLPVGTTRVIEWMDSMRAQLFTRSGITITPTAPLQRDLSIALGGFTVKSVVSVRARDMHTVEVVSWRVQVCDRYDWILGGQAIIMIPPGVALPPIPQGAGSTSTFFGRTVVRFNDQWMAEIEANGGARAYDIFSEEFAAPISVAGAFSV